MFERIVDQVSREWQKDLNRFFTTLGVQAAAVYESLKSRKENVPEDALFVDSMLEAMQVQAVTEQRLGPQFSAYYASTGELTYDAVSKRLGVTVGWDLRDQLARDVVAHGGRRLGLLDIAGDTRSALFRALSDSRVAGHGPQATARLIRNYVPAGRYTGGGLNTRSEVIARTETKFAQNISSISAYRQSEVVTHLLAFDAQGARTDEECLSRNGTVFTFSEADLETEAEHPNGTLSWAPVVQ